MSKLWGNKILLSVIIPTHNRHDQVMDCVNSLLRSSYKSIDVIVVDDASIDGSYKILRKKYQNNPHVKVISSKLNLGPASARNLGAKYAKGEYLLFIDSDNVVDREMLNTLVEFMDTHDDCVMVGPLMKYLSPKDRIWLYFADINMYTSQAIYKGTHELDTGQYNEVSEVGHLPNCFMVRKADFEKVNGFDEKYFIMYEEADLAEKLKKNTNKKIFLYSKAITQHDVKYSLSRKSVPGMRNAVRSFLTARNRVYFMKKNAPLLNFVVFLLIFMPLLNVYYVYQSLRSGHPIVGWYYVKGTFVGLFY